MSEAKIQRYSYIVSQYGYDVFSKNGIMYIYKDDEALESFEMPEREHLCIYFLKGMIATLSTNE